MALRPAQHFTGAQLALVEALRRHDATAAQLATRGGARINLPSADGMLPLAFLVATDDRAGIALACRLGANPDLLVPTRGTPLSMAATLRSSGPLDALLAAGADPNSRGAGRPVIHSAGRASAYGNVRLLVQRGADIDAQAPSGDTLLLAGLFAGDIDLALLALELGADPKIANRFGVLPSKVVRNLYDRLSQDARRSPNGRKVAEVARRTGAL